MKKTPEISRTIKKRTSTVTFSHLNIKLNKILFLLLLFMMMISACNNDNDDNIQPEPFRQFEIQGSQYDENNHFFLGHFFRDNYEIWLKNIPRITSGVNIHRVEVYVLSRTNEDSNIRSIVALMDLGEATRIYSPDVTKSGIQSTNNPIWNGANDLFDQLTEYDMNAVDADLQAKFPSFESFTDYVKVATARKLDNAEFTINKELGYITLLRKLQSDGVLAVSYQYSYNGASYQVGEIESDYSDRKGDEVIYLKMLRPNKIATKLNTWDLMMKNIYNLNFAQVSSEGFELRLFYRNDITGQDFASLPEGQLLKDIPLIEALRLDQLDKNYDHQPDGNFDFIEGRTIDTKSGNIIFPVLEPFGSHLKSWFNTTTEGHLIEKYVYDELYSNHRASAEQEVTKDKFVISGKMQ